MPGGHTWLCNIHMVEVLDGEGCCCCFWCFAVFPAYSTTTTSAAAGAAAAAMSMQSCSSPPWGAAFTLAVGKHGKLDVFTAKGSGGVLMF